MKNAIAPLLVAAAAFGVLANSPYNRAASVRTCEKILSPPAASGDSRRRVRSLTVAARIFSHLLSERGESESQFRPRESGVSAQDAEVLPEGKGRDLMLEACVQCHDFKVVFSQRKTTDAWRRTVNEMIWRGAPLVGDEAGEITNYLGSHFRVEKGNKD